MIYLQTNSLKCRKTEESIFYTYHNRESRFIMYSIFSQPGVQGALQKLEAQQKSHQEEDKNNFLTLKDIYRKGLDQTSKGFDNVERNAKKYHEEAETNNAKRHEKLIQELKGELGELKGEFVETIHTTAKKAFEEAFLQSKSNCSNIDSVKKQLYGSAVETTKGTVTVGNFVDDDESTIATSASALSMLKEKERQLNAAKVNLEKKEAEREKRDELKLKLAKEQVERDAAKKMKAKERAFLAGQKKIDALYRKEMSSKDKECAQLKRELEAAQKEMAARADVLPSRTTRSRSKAKANEAKEAADEEKNE